MPDLADRASLDAFFHPESIAVVGATDSPGKPGNIVFQNLRSAAARVYPVHPKAETVLGVPAFPSIGELPETVDLAVLAVGAKASVEAAGQAAAAGVRALIVLAGGFAETGDEGRALQEDLASIARAGGPRILGPNTLGLQFPSGGIDTVFVDHEAFSRGTERGLVLISQSGSVAVEALGEAALSGMRLHAFVGLGNEVDLRPSELIEYFSADPAVGAICLYLEHLGTDRTLLETAGRAARRLPVVVLKAGRTSAGMAAVASHTGRLAGSDRVVDGALRAYGIHRVMDDEELLDAGRAHCYGSLPSGGRVAILTPAGGYGVMMADEIASLGADGPLVLAELSGRSTAELRSRVLSFASVHNPVDLTAGVDDEGFRAAMDIVLEDEGVDILIVLAFFAPPGLTDALVDHIAAAADTARKAGKSLVVFAHCGTRTPGYLKDLSDRGVPAYGSLRRTIAAARALAAHGRARASLDTGLPVDGPSPAHSAGSPLLGALSGALDEETSKRVIGAYGIASPPSRVFAAAEAPGGPSVARVSGADPGFPGPYALKVSSAAIRHKTEAGALRLGIAEGDLAVEVEDLRRAFPGADILVEAMVPASPVELILGAFRDPSLGPAIMVGSGGVLTELRGDVSFRLLPDPGAGGAGDRLRFDRREAESMLDELQIGRLFRGYRGLSVNREGLVDAILAVSRLVQDCGERFLELDINPLVPFGPSAGPAPDWVALDAKLTLVDSPA